MAQIPMEPGRGRMPGTPDLRTGFGMVTPDDFGTREFNEWGKLGRAIGNAGDAQMRWGIQKYNEKAEADALVGLNAAMQARGEERNRLMALKGSEAANAPKMYEEFAKQQDDEIVNSLKTPLAKEMYRRRMMDYDRQTAQSIDAFTLQESERHRQTALGASVAQEINNAALNAGNGVAFVDAVNRIKGYNAERFRGEPQEYIDLQNQNDVSLAIEQTAGVLAKSAGSQAALDFLNSGIEQELGDGPLKMKFDALRKQYAKAKDYSEDVKLAHAWAADPEYRDDPNKAILKAYELYPDNEDGRAEKLIAQFFRAAQNTTSAERTALIQNKRDMLNKFFTAGGLTNMSREDQATIMTDADLFQTVTKYQEWLDKAENKKLVADEKWFWQMQQKQPSEVKAWLAEPAGSKGGESNFDLMLRKAGGKQKLIDGLLGHSLASDREFSEKSFSTASSFNIDKYFRAIYSEVYKTPWLVAWDRPDAYDPKSQEAKSRENGFWVEFNRRLAEEEEKVLKRKATTSEQAAIAYQMKREALADPDVHFMQGKVYTTPSADAPTEMDVSLDTVPVERREFLRGTRPISRMNPKTKEIEHFGKIDKDSPDLPYDIAALKLDDVMRAGQAGVVAVDGRDIKYDAGDHIGKRSGAIVVLGPYGEFKGGDVSAFSQPAPAARPEAEKPEPPWQNYMKGLKKKWGERMTARWDGKGEKWDVVIPNAGGGARRLEINAAGHMVGGGFLPEEPLSDGAAKANGEYILLEKLNEEIEELRSIEERLGRAKGQRLGNLQEIHLQDRRAKQQKVVEKLRRELDAATRSNRSPGNYAGGQGKE